MFLEWENSIFRNESILILKGQSLYCSMTLLGFLSFRSKTIFFTFHPLKVRCQSACICCHQTQSSKPFVLFNPCFIRSNITKKRKFCFLRQMNKEISSFSFCIYLFMNYQKILKIFYFVRRMGEIPKFLYKYIYAPNHACHVMGNGLPHGLCH